jgi:hypothetical protein
MIFKYHHWGKCFDESPKRRVYKWYIIPKPKVKETTKFRSNFKTCWILTIKRIQFLTDFLWPVFWRFLFKIFEHVFFGSLKVTYVLKIFGYSKSINLLYEIYTNNSSRTPYCFKTWPVSSRHAWGTVIIPRWIYRGIW